MYLIFVIHVIVNMLFMLGEKCEIYKKNGETRHFTGKTAIVLLISATPAAGKVFVRDFFYSLFLKM